MTKNVTREDDSPVFEGPDRPGLRNKSRTLRIYVGTKILAMQLEKRIFGWSVYRNNQSIWYERYQRCQTHVRRCLHLVCTLETWPIPKMVAKFERADREQHADLYYMYLPLRRSTTEALTRDMKSKDIRGCVMTGLELFLMHKKQGP